MKKLAAAALVLFVSAPSIPHAQWLTYKTPGLARTKDGRPDLRAPGPRMPDGKPDFSGVWGFDAGPSLFFIGGELKPGEADPSVGKNIARANENFGLDDPQVHCLPEGPRFNHFIALPHKVVQTPGLIVILSEDLTYRQIFLDGRPLPAVSNPSFMGYSVGRWEGDTLVVESTGYKNKTWLDFAGHTHSESLRVVERWRRLDTGRIEIQETFTDPALYKRPMHATVRASLVPDTDLLEYVCSENEKDQKEKRLIGTASGELKAIKPVKVAADVLKQYVGDYDFRWPENPTIPSIWTIAMGNGELLLQGAPLIPLSESRFLWAGSNYLQFEKDAQGRVTRFKATFVEGDLVGTRIAAAR